MSTKPKYISIIEFIKGGKEINPNRRFIIPIYQRKYNWSRYNCEKLYNDLKDTKISKKNHYMGSIVYTHDDNVCNIVDGQQRLTTITLLLLAILKSLRSGEISSSHTNLDDEIQKLLFQNEVFKLELEKSDNDILKKIIGNEQLEGEDYKSSLVVNYRYFREKIRNSNSNISVDELLESIEKLMVIDFSVESGDNPEQIFESINATGMPLSVGDEIRNYILMGLSNQPDKQDELYSEYWVKIEKCTTYKRINEFFADFLKIDEHGDSRLNTYDSFKKYAEHGFDPEKDDIPRTMSSSQYVKKLLEQLLKFAKYFEILRTFQSKFDTNRVEMDYCLRRLGELNITFTHPFFMKILERHDNKELSDSDVLEIFEVTECYLFRRYICGLSTQSLNKMFASLDKAVSDNCTNCLDYLSIFKYVLINKESTYVFPGDTVFADNFKSKDLYKRNTKNYCNYILERYEHSLIDDPAEHDSDIYGRIHNNNNKMKWTIEHIMPQNPNINWSNFLSARYSNKAGEIHKNHVHKLGNLTFSGHNSDLSNYSFYEKLFTVIGCYDKSGVRLNEEIAKKYQSMKDNPEKCVWGKEEIDVRTDDMVKLAVDTLWKMPTTDFNPPIQNEQTEGQKHTLDDDFAFTNRGIVRFCFRYPQDIQPEVKTVTNWKEMFKTVVKTLYDSDKTLIASVLTRTAETGLEKYVTTVKKDKSTFCVDETAKIYIKTNHPAKEIYRLLRLFLDLYRIDYSNLEFYLSE